MMMLLAVVMETVVGRSGIRTLAIPQTLQRSIAMALLPRDLIPKRRVPRQRRRAALTALATAAVHAVPVPGTGHGKGDLWWYRRQTDARAARPTTPVDVRGALMAGDEFAGSR